jgi:hypothetical protein
VAATRTGRCGTGQKGIPVSWWTTAPETIYRQVVGTTSADGLLTERQVADESGLAAELVSSWIPRSLEVDQAELDGDAAAVYDELGLWRAKVAKLLLDMNVRMNLIKAAVHETATIDQCRYTVEKFTSGAQRPAE